MSEPAFPTLQPDWLGVPEALFRILSAVPSPRVARVPLAEAAGRVLADDVCAAATLPPWDNSAMDGYALRSGDLPEGESEFPVSLPLAGEVAAGDAPHPTPPRGHAVRIMTGAPIPDGLDTVIRVEDTDAERGESGRVEIRRARDRGRNIRPAGKDMQEGELLLESGTEITPGRVALLAAAGVDPVAVMTPPVVAIIPTGDELVLPADFPGDDPGRCIPESNGPTLSAACRMIGIPVRLYPPTPDEADALRSVLRHAREHADAVITLGGASMGTADLVKSVLDELGFQLGFWRVRMRPGSPFSFGHLPASRGGSGSGQSPVPVFGLPGNPASAFVTFQLLVRPFLLASAGMERIHRPVVQAIAGTRFSAPADRAIFPRVVLSIDDAGGLVADSTGSQSSGLVQSLGMAHALAVVPGGSSVEAGDSLDVILLDDGATGSEDAGYTAALAEAGSGRGGETGG